MFRIKARTYRKDGKATGFRAFSFINIDCAISTKCWWFDDTSCLSVKQSSSHIVNILWYMSYDDWGILLVTPVSRYVSWKFLNLYVVKIMNLRKVGINQTTLTTDFVENSVKLSNAFFIYCHPDTFLIIISGKYT